LLSNPRFWNLPANYTELNSQISNPIHRDIFRWVVRMREAYEHLCRYRLPEAMNVLSALPDNFAKMALTMDLQAQTLFENDEYQRACEIYERIRHQFPLRVEGMEIYSTLLWQMHDSHALSKLSAEMTSMARFAPESWCAAANCFSLEGDHVLAIECLERALQLNPRYGYAWSLLGLEYIDINDLERAQLAFTKATMHSPNDYRGWYGLGLVHSKQGRFDMGRRM